MQKHSKQSNISIKSVLCVSILIIGISMFSTMRVNATTVSYNPPTYSTLTPHAPISILSDSGLEVFPGTGTEEDPYMIEGYNITTNDGTGIFIRDTTKYFVIRNCYIDAEGSGIYIRFVADGTVTIINNTCNNHDWEGIKLDSSVSSTVANNTCNNNNDYGIYLIGSSSSTVANNTCNNNNHGICLYASDSSTVANNTFTNCGLEIREYSTDSYLSNTVESNWVNGKKLGFYTNLDSTIINEPVHGQLILVNSTNVTVRDQILNNASIGLFLYSCTSSVIINNTCNNNNYGILLYYSNSSTISNNMCNNNRVGISLIASESSTVINNTCSNNNEYGIVLQSSSCFLSYNLLQENEGYGVYIFPHSDNNIIHHNAFVDNNLGGTSQAYDDGANNYWYDIETSEGNYWSDWSGTGSYSIDGFFTDVYDLYPLDEPAEYTTDETKMLFTFTLLIVVIPVILTKLFSRKRR